MQECRVFAMGVPGYRRYPQRKIWEKNPIFGGTAVPPTVLEGLGLVGNVFFFFFFSSRQDVAQIFQLRP